MKLLIIYGSDQGQTAKIATYIARQLSARGAEVDVVDGRTIPPDLSLARYSAVIIGASLHTWKFQDYILRFVRAHQEELRRMPSAFFSVSLMEAHPNPKQRARLAPPISRFLEETSWQPDVVRSFAGAIPRTRGGGWFMRRVVWRRLKRDGIATDTASHEYTDWDAVRRFANEFTSQVQSAQLATVSGYISPGTASRKVQ